MHRHSDLKPQACRLKPLSDQDSKNAKDTKDEFESDAAWEVESSDPNPLLVPLVL